MIGQSAFPDSRRGFAAAGAAPAGPSPFTASGAQVRANIRRGPFGGWMGRFRERIAGTVGGQRGQDASMRGGRVGTSTLMPHRVAVYRKPAFWAPATHYKRQEYLVAPPDLPGTAIQYTLFHPVYIPGLQGWRDTLPTNYFWRWGQNTNFERWDMLGRLARPGSVVTGRGRQQNVWKPQMRVPQGVGQGQVFMQPRPFYTPIIVNLPRVGRAMPWETQS